MGDRPVRASRRSGKHETLRSLGFQPVPIVVVPHAAPLDVPAEAFQIGDSRVEAYFFADPVAAARGMSQLAPRDSTATAFTSNNMVVIVRGSRATRERIQRALRNPKTEATLNP